MPWRVFVAGVALVLVGCGSSGRVGPTPSPSPSSLKLGGVVSGHYLLQIQPGPGCAMRKGTVSFPMTAAPAGNAPHPGDQILLEGNPSALELELEYTDFSLRGGFGTTGDGVLSSEGLRLWVSSIGTGSVTQDRDGRGEVVTGTLIGSLALGMAGDDEGALGTCSALDHSFTLRAQ